MTYVKLGALANKTIIVWKPNDLLIGQVDSKNPIRIRVWLRSTSEIRLKLPSKLRLTCYRLTKMTQTSAVLRL